MANLAASAVTKKKSWQEGGLTGKRFVAIRCEVVLAAQGSGGADAKIPASAFGFSKIEQVSPFTKSDDTLVVVANPNIAQDEILLKAAATNAPADYTGTFQFTIKGQPANAG